MAMVSKGFTLIELLIVVALIGILSVTVAFNMIGSLSRGRDSRRVQDMVAIGKAVEQCYSVDGTYPGTVSFGTGSNITCSGNITLNNVPQDPQGSGLYVYSYNVDNLTTPTIFCLCAYLENTGTGNADNGGVSGVCAWGVSKNYFCVSNQQ